MSVHTLLIAGARLAEGSGERHLPMPPYVYGLIALAVFALAYAVTYAFRGAANRHNPAAFHAHDHKAVEGGSQRSIDSGH